MLCVRSWRVVLALENWIAAALLAAYAVLVLLIYPRFFTDVLPTVMAGYIPIKEAFFSFILHAALPLWAAILLLIARLKRGAMFAPPFCVLLAASVGFAISYIVQQKGWPYQSYPMLALALMALAFAVVDRDAADNQSGQSSRLVAGATAVLMAVVTFFWMNIAVDRSAVAAAIREIKPHPTMLALSADISIGNPITRQSGEFGSAGPARSGSPSGWNPGARTRRSTRKPMRSLKPTPRRDRVMLTEDIARHKPDVILVQFMKDIDWLGWARSDPALAGLLQSYRPYKTVGDVLILRRVEGQLGRIEEPLPRRPARASCGPPDPSYMSLGPRKCGINAYPGGWIGGLRMGRRRIPLGRQSARPACRN